MYLHVDYFKRKFVIRLRIGSLKLTIEVPP